MLYNLVSDRFIMFDKNKKTAVKKLMMKLNRNRKGRSNLFSERFGYFLTESSFDRTNRCKNSQFHIHIKPRILIINCIWWYRKIKSAKIAAGALECFYVSMKIYWQRFANCIVRSVWIPCPSPSRVADNDAAIRFINLAPVLLLRVSNAVYTFERISSLDTNQFSKLCLTFKIRDNEIKEPTTENVNILISQVYFIFLVLFFSKCSSWFSKVQLVPLR